MTEERRSGQIGGRRGGGGGGDNGKGGEVVVDIESTISSPPLSPTTSPRMSSTTSSSFILSGDGSSTAGSSSLRGVDDDDQNHVSKGPPTRTLRTKTGRTKRGRRHKDVTGGTNGNGEGQEVVVMRASRNNNKKEKNMSMKEGYGGRSEQIHDDDQCSDDDDDDSYEHPGAVHVVGPNLSPRSSSSSTSPRRWAHQPAATTTTTNNNRTSGGVESQLPRALPLNNNGDGNEEQQPGGMMVIEGFQAPPTTMTPSPLRQEDEERMVQRIADAFRERTVRAEEVIVRKDGDNQRDLNGNEFSTYDSSTQEGRTRRRICGFPYLMFVCIMCTFLVVLVAIVIATVLVLGVIDKNDSIVDDPSSYLDDGKISTIVSILQSQGVNITLEEVVVDDVKSSSSSPQYQALYWLAYQDNNTYEMYILDEDDAEQDSKTDSKYMIVERYVLAVMYYSTGGSIVGGGEWINDYGWVHTHIDGDDKSTSPSVCEWYGVQCHDDESTPEDPTLHGFVRTLDLEDNRLAGTLPVELVYLKGLLRLDVNDDHLVGTIPTEYGLLTMLTWLTTFGNSLHGLIPTEIGNLRNLGILEFGNNRLTGTIPTEIGLISDYLEILHFGENDLKGTIPTEIGKLSLLNHFSASRNNLIGDVPSELGMLTKLTYLSLWNNKLEGTIPTQLGNLSQLLRFWFDKNDIVGNVDSLFCDESANYTLVDTARFPNLDDLNADCLAALEGNVGVGVVVVPEEIEIVCTCCSECF